ncbi:MAG: GAF domain-containing sensor histidine kinase, partial [Spirochaetales bacterium]|nr:GAF domain-containing sensor histidine kinase [Spirochaetales bacterium]
DPYIRRHRVKSILCLPLLHQGRVRGYLYLENRLSPGVFDGARVETLQLLCAQFAATLQNAVLYQAVEERLRFEKLVSGLSAAFVNLPTEEVDHRLVLWLRRLLNFLGADRGAVYQLDPDAGELALTHHYTRRGSPKPPGTLQPFPWYADKIAGSRTIVFRRPREIPAQPQELRRRFLDQGILSYIAVPMSAGGTPLGMLELASFRSESSWAPDIIKRLRLIEEIFAQALKRKISEEQLRRRTRELEETAEKLKGLSEHLQDVREEERADIAREIHDELGQTLTVLRMDTAWVARHLRDDASSLREKLQSMIGLIESSAETLQRIASALRPQMLDVLGLFDAIEWLAEEFRKTEEITCDLTFEGPQVQGEKHTIVLFRIVQEALTNIARHAQARKATVRLRVTDRGVLLEIEDDGRGITESQVAGRNSLGLIGMRERVSSLNGTFEIGRVRKRGTRLRVTLPYGGNQ